MRASKMNALDRKNTMMNFLRKTALWMLLLPLATYSVGVASNQLVLIANHDKFPVIKNSANTQRIELTQYLEYQEYLATVNSPDSTADDRQAAAQEAATIKIMHESGMIDRVHCLMTKQTHLNALAGIFDLHNATHSIGDGLLYLGEWLWSPCLLLWGFVMVGKAHKQ